MGLPSGLDQRHLFYLAQAGVGVLFLALLWRVRERDAGSQFRSDQTAAPKPDSMNHPKKREKTQSALADARLQKPQKPKAEPQKPLALPGIVITGEPHEILGVERNASPEQVRAAWRELMKHYHPDKLAQVRQLKPGSAEWREAQKIAEAINRAKDAMLAR